MLRLPTLTPTEAESLCLLASHGHDLPLLAMDAGSGLTQESLGRLTLVHRARMPAETAQAQMLVVRGLWGGAQFSVCMPADTAALVAQRVCGALPLQELPPAWLQALDALVARWIQLQVSGLGRGSAQVLELTRLPDASPLPCLAHAFEWHAAWQEDEVPLQGLLQVDSLGLMLMAGLAQERGQTPPPNNLAPAVAHRLTLVAGESTLSVRQLRELKAGDSVWLQTRYLDDDQQLRVRLGAGAFEDWSFLARLNGHELTVMQAPRKHIAMNLEDPDLSPAPADDEPLPLEQLPVRLSFDLGEVTLTLEELQQLQPGQVIATQRLAQDYVSVRANGALVGRGVLMELDGRLAVSLTAVAAPAPN